MYQNPKIWFRLLQNKLKRKYRYCLQVSISKPIKIDDGEKIWGYVDRITIDRGEMIIEGWARIAEFQIRTALETVDVTPDLLRQDVPAELNGKGYRIKLGAVDRLSVVISETVVITLNLVDLRTRLWTMLKVPGLVISSWLGRPNSERLGGKVPLAAKALFVSENFVEPSEPSPVDVILPVYGAHDDLARCLDHLDQYTDKSHRIILIDDASPDPRIAKLLEDFSSKRANVVFIRQASNSGFVASVNQGLSIATGHVVLLNSDAFVSKGWLPRLMEPIIADDTVASVSPMTNNGEILSVPVICKASAMSEDVASALAVATQKLHPRRATASAPTGVGFCMAMSRKWLSQVPRLDIAFGRGYGEEVDWCQRVIRLGAKNILTGAVFVGHRGSASFGHEKHKAQQESALRIRKRYPNYDAEVQEFIAADPLVGPRLVLALASIAATSTSLIPVYLAHQLGGGAEKWLTEELAARRKQEGNSVIIRCSRSGHHVVMEVHTAEGRTIGRVPLLELPTYLSFLKGKEVIYSNLVDAPDALQILDTACQSLTKNDRLKILVHDHFVLCPGYTLLNADGRYCDIPDQTTCENCYSRLPRKATATPQTIQAWRARWRIWLERADEITVFSESSLRLVSKVFPDFSDKLVVRPHSMSWLPGKVTPKQGKPVTIGVLGSIGHEKGAAVIQDLAARNANLKIVVIGTMDMAYHHPKIHIHGKYDRNDISKLAERYGISRWLFPSIFPETFSYAVRECLATQLPTIVFDLGAQAEAARESVHGVLIPLQDEEALLHALMKPDI